MDITERLKPHVSRILESAAEGNGLAKQIISLHRMHVSCPSDPGAPALCETAFSEWLSQHPSTDHSSPTKGEVR